MLSAFFYYCGKILSQSRGGWCKTHHGEEPLGDVAICEKCAFGKVSAWMATGAKAPSP